MELLFCASNSDIKEPAFLLDSAGLDERILVGQDLLLDTANENRLKLETLRGMQCHQAYGSAGVVEVIGGLLTNSLALLSDAAHMFTDSAALAIALAAVKIGQHPPDDQ